MTVWQLPSGSWPRAAIHDTVASIVRQPAYRRDARTLLDRFIGWLGDLLARFTEMLGGMPHGRFVATIAATIIVVLVIGRFAYASRLRATTFDDGSRPRQVRGESADLWAEAEQLAAEGRFTEAAHAMYRATLFLLASGGQVRLHDSKTSGDYARELRRRGASAFGAFHHFGARYDRIIYGTGSCDASEYRALVADANAVAATRTTERAA
ncbi:MAG TPA: DUF4129 domain-containing protein [Gemmatimonadaceae bacterium]|jgi:hypothetical protein